MPAGGCEGDESYLGLHDYIEAFSTMNEPHFETFSTEDFLFTTIPPYTILLIIASFSTLYYYLIVPCTIIQNVRVA